MNYLKTAILLAALAALLVFLGGLMGGRQGAIIGLVMAGVMNFGTYWFSDKIVLAMYRAKQVDEKTEPELYSMVRDLSQKAGLPMPKVYTMENDTPNAFATGRNPSHAAIAVTTGIRSLLNKNELRGVLAHELSHIQNRDILIATLAATIAGAISYLSHMAMWFGMGNRNDREGGNPIVLIVMMIVAPLAAMIIQMAISRSREYGADAGGAKISDNPLYLAEALKKLAYYNKRIPMRNANEATAHMFIVSPLSGGAVMKLFSTHPPVEERIKRLNEMVYNRTEF